MHIIYTVIFFLISLVQAQEHSWDAIDKIMGDASKTVDGKNGVVLVADTPIYFRACLSGKKVDESFGHIHGGFTRDEFFEQYNKTILLHSLFASWDAAYAHYIHGTMMTSLIAGKKNCSVKNEINHRDKIIVRGIAHKSKILPINWGIDFSEQIKENGKMMYGKPGRYLFMALEEVVKRAQELKSFGKMKNVLTVVVNISAEDPDPASMKKNKYKNWFEPLSGRNDILVIAAAGNSHRDLNHNCSILPICLDLTDEEQTRIIRVGGLAYDATTGEPKLWITPDGKGSNYGDRHLDILAPAHQIPAMTPPAGGFGIAYSGTSHATAIVSGAATLLASCNPEATPAQIKKALIDNADVYTHLSTMVKGGKVLNIAKAVKAFCRPTLKGPNQASSENLIEALAREAENAL